MSFTERDSLPANWRCMNCSGKLGVKDGTCLVVKYKDLQWVVDGSDFNVTILCRHCSTLNVFAGVDRTTTPAAAHK
jgi:hypothetical protein